MKPKEHDEARWLAWIEGELDEAATREVEARMQADPELSERLHAMRRDREALQSIVEPPVPAGLVNCINSLPDMKRNRTLSKGGPGQFRQGKHNFDLRARFKSNLRTAAMFIIGIGLLACLLLLVPMDVFRGDDVQTNETATGSDLLEFLAARPTDQPSLAGNPSSASEDIQATVGTPEPLAMLLPAPDNAIGYLRRLTYRCGGTLVRNATPEDFKNSDLSASTGSDAGGSATAGETFEPNFLQGNPEWVPPIDDQFEYARSGAVWTIVIPLSRLDAFLASFDDLEFEEVRLLLLSDHLDHDQGTVWMHPVSARAAVANWPRTSRDTLINVPIFVGH
ncbi:MAG: hypothetical protein VX908_07550 [Planctomycetota bacterium]|nr:hypothetical protein [Planctomycetota bacterium]